MGDPVQLRDGSTVTIRSLAPGDGDLVRAIYREMSDVSRQRRFLAPAEELSDEDVAYLTDVGHPRHEALVALAKDGRPVGVARYVRRPGDRETGEVAVVVIDSWHRRGLGRVLLDQLTERARANGLKRYTAVVSPENDVVLDALERNGADRTGVTEDGEVEFVFDLPAEGLGERLTGALRAAGALDWGFIGQALRLLPWRGRS